MPWQNTQGGGQGGGRGPWGGGGGGPRQNGGGGGPQPNLDDILKKGQDRMKSAMPGGFGGRKGVIIAIVVLLALWAFSGFYRVNQGEQGVVLIFGAWDGTLQPEGLHWAPPAPIGEVFTPLVTRARTTEVGFSTIRRGDEATGTRNEPNESLMLTGDENIIDIDFEVFWQINDAGAFLFNLREPEETVKAVAESAMREVVGQTPLQAALTSARDDIERETAALMQTILDDYQSGVQVTSVNLKKSDTPAQVLDAFRDVQAAGADREAAINEAQQYRNEIIPVARGEAAQIVNDAEGYREQIVADAEGQAARFIAVYDEYVQAEDVTKRRIYLETMENIMRDVDKVIIDSESGGTGVVPYLALPEIQRRVQQGGN